MYAPADFTRRDAFAFWHREHVRFSDTDMLGHVNNVAFAALVESGRTAFTHQSAWPRAPAGTLFVTARLEIDYRAELHWPAEIDVGARLTRLGRSSLVLVNAVFRGDTCAAVAHTTLVLIDHATRKSTSLPAAYRAALAHAGGLAE